MKNSDVLRGFNKNIYKQCIWIVKDYYRLLALSEIAEDKSSHHALLIGLNDEEIEEHGYILGQNVINEAKFKLQCISNALSDVPEEYRDGLFRNIVENEYFGDDACYNTWKRWKFTFIRSLARNLNLC